MPPTPAPVQRKTATISPEGNAIAASALAKMLADVAGHHFHNNFGKIASAVNDAVELPFAGDSAE